MCKIHTVCVRYDASYRESSARSPARSLARSLARQALELLQLWPSHEALYSVGAVTSLILEQLQPGARGQHTKATTTSYKALAEVSERP